LTLHRLIEAIFPLIKVSEDSSHEKMCHAGHIKSLHIWPARRPLSACRAVIAATLLIDPKDAPTEIKEKYEELSKSSNIFKQRKFLCQKIEEITKWGTENSKSLEILRDLIKFTYKDKTPKLVDVFAGGGAIPLEGMRLGCAVTAIEYNPVAWFILKATLEFPFMFKDKSWPEIKNQKINKQTKLIQSNSNHIDFHVRYWANWVLERARTNITELYPTNNNKKPIAYLWVRTIPCQDPDCGGIIPILKTLKISTKKNKKRALRLKPNNKTKIMEFEIFEPNKKDKIEKPLKSRKGVKCPFCEIDIPISYIKSCGFPDEEGNKKLSEQMICVVEKTKNGKDFRLPQKKDLDASELAKIKLQNIMNEIPYGNLNEKLPESDSSGAGRAITAPQYGFLRWKEFYTPRQLFSIFSLIKLINLAKIEMMNNGYSKPQITAIVSYLCCILNKFADYNCSFVTWQPAGLKGAHFYYRWAVPIILDFVENNPWGEGSATWHSITNWILDPLERIKNVKIKPILPDIILNSATDVVLEDIDAIITDPPYYDAIPYSDLSDFFYILLRRVIGDFFPDQFKSELTPKAEELVQYTSRAEGSLQKAKEFYEKGMSQAFLNIMKGLNEDGRAVFVFAHKDYEAWETLVSSIINAGAVVTASWPIDTEMKNRTRGIEGAALATSIWLVCRKRDEIDEIGRYSLVKKEMVDNIIEKLRYFWDQGISGPDFIWSAIGPALESYSKYKQVRRIDGSLFSISEFLKEVRKITTDFALGQILHGESTEGLDEWTRYYLMHLYNFKYLKTPAGESILLAQAYGLDLDTLLSNRGFLLQEKNNEIRILRFNERKSDRLGTPHQSGLLPYIDMIHHLMLVWDSGDLKSVEEYVEKQALSENTLFWAISQAIIEISAPNSKERTVLEALMSWGRPKKIKKEKKVKKIEEFIPNRKK